MRLGDKIAYVTGAGSGIGRATAEAMAREGAKVAVVDINDESVKETAHELQSTGTDVIALTADIGDGEQVRKSIEVTIAHFGRLDIMHLNAGASKHEDSNVVDTPDSVWDATLQLNLMGSVYGARYGIPHMIGTGGGSIVITSSLAEETGDYSRVAYAASKGALTTLTRYIATVFGRSGINANAILPGLVLSREVAAQFPETLRNAVRQHQVTDRFTTPEDVAQLAVFLASDEALAIRGQAIHIDAGISAMGSASPTLATAMQELGI